MVTLPFIKPYKNCRPFLSRPISNVKYPRPPGRLTTGLLRAAPRLPRCPDPPVGFISRGPHLMFPPVLPRNNPLLSKCLLPYPSSILLRPPGILSFPVSTISHLTKFIIPGSSQWAPLHACSSAPDRMCPLPGLYIPFSAYCGAL